MYLSDYERFLTSEKDISDNTISAYMHDVENFEVFVQNRGINDLKDVTSSAVMAYLIELKQNGKSESTANRKLASLRNFYDFMGKFKKMKENPTIGIKAPKIDRKEVEFLSVEEIDNLMNLPDDSVKGKRDRAILELLYATGIRASELIEMKIQDVNIRMGFIKCTGEHGKARIIPMGRICRTAIENYIFDARPMLKREKESDYLFINYLGEELTRQGLWKILKEYGEKAGLDKSLTPQIIRNSFAVHMLQNGADVKSLQELMGHEDISATQAYLMVTKNRIKDVYDKAHPRA